MLPVNMGGPRRPVRLPPWQAWQVSSYSRFPALTEAGFPARGFRCAKRAPAAQKKSRENAVFIGVVLGYHKRGFAVRAPARHNRRMKTAALVPLEEYLNTTYNPDCDYVDGEVVERNLGEQDHSDIQSELVHFFRTRRKQWSVYAYVEQRVQVAPRRFRVPD